MFGRLVIIIMGLLGGAGIGQAPEIMTQYEQRLGGAISELKTIIQQFDQDAARNGLDRERALASYKKSPEPFLRDRGQSIATAIFRFNKLTKQSADFQRENQFYKPVYMLLNADQKLLEGVMDDYTFGLPVTSSGILYGAVGVFFGGLFGALLRMLSGLDTRRSKVRISE